jgi:hypothetical protein
MAYIAPLCHHPATRFERRREQELDNSSEFIVRRVVDPQRHSADRT